MRPPKLRARRAERSIVALQDLGLALPDKHVRTAKRADVQGLVTRVEDEDALHRARSVAPLLAIPAATGGRARGSVTGEVRRELRRNAAVVTGSRSPHPSYAADLAPLGTGEAFPHDAS